MLDDVYSEEEQTYIYTLFRRRGDLRKMRDKPGAGAKHNKPFHGLTQKQHDELIALNWVINLINEITTDS